MLLLAVGKRHRLNEFTYVEPVETQKFRLSIYHSIDDMVRKYFCHLYEYLHMRARCLARWIDHAIDKRLTQRAKREEVGVY